MPELPEVETTKKDLEKQVILQKIRGCWIGLPSRVFVRSQSIGNKPNEIVKGKTIKKIRREGKNIIFELSKDISVLIHQKISGHILLGKWEMKNNQWVSSNKALSEKTNSFIHFAILLMDGRMIVLSDPRKFFKVEFWSKEDLENSETMNKLGPDALKVGLKEFRKLLEKRKQEIKKLLLNQNFVSGIGNIYSDEILWEAKISPFRKANSLNEREVKALHKSISKVFKKALELKGDSISDYRLITGEKGGFQNFHKVYQKDGQLCKRKDGGIIKRKKFGNRSLRYCPICQR